MTLEEIEAASAAVQQTPNRITMDFIKSQIARAWYFTADKVAEIADVEFGDWNTADPLTDSPSMKTMTVCILETVNGFNVIGHSAPIDPANYNAELGRKFAYEQAFRQLWPLFAFARLQNEAPTGSASTGGNT